MKEITPPQKKYLGKLWKILWLSNWSKGAHFTILHRVIFGREAKLTEERVGWKDLYNRTIDASVQLIESAAEIARLRNENGVLECEIDAIHKTYQHEIERLKDALRFYRDASVTKRITMHADRISEVDDEGDFYPLGGVANVALGGK